MAEGEEDGRGEEGGEEGDGEEGEEEEMSAERRAQLREWQRMGACEHVGAGAAPPLAHGMCRQCFEEFITVSGGVFQVRHCQLCSNG